MALSKPLMDSLMSQYRGELSAIEAYDRALQKFAGQNEEAELVRLREDHVSAVNRLGAIIRQHGGLEPESSGAWGSLTTGLERLASIVNDEVPLRVLHRGEVVGYEGYAKLLSDPQLDADILREIQGLLDHSQDHLTRLERMLEQLPAAPNRPMI
ncbi:ferritin-like domain-containing protein [Nannocystis bainbridge]|uniref:Ferritin-like domain-containing protein n=1 Tax=Nannocystis bainbridge TaxID=2995303 RepID=A0ABT5DUK8_9BACT|nr:ferritin-like domain-containing protein [Nannocystis bainbridge]MDC0717289.1 ferritin-like domain-containing protein [Nannocystis bainbridge]